MENAGANLPRGLLGAAALLTLMAGGAPVATAEIDVVASIKPVHSLVAGVMAGVGEPDLLVKGAASEHSYISGRREHARSSRPRWCSGSARRWRPSWSSRCTRSPATPSVIDLWRAPGLTLLPTREGGMWDAHEPGAEYGGADHLGADGDDGKHGEVEQQSRAPCGRDRHAHLAGSRQRQGALAAIASALGEADPSNAAAYHANAERLRERLDELDRSLEDRLATVADRPYVVFHDAYQYFEHRYGVKAVGAITINPTVRPSAQRLAEIREQLEQLDAACVFAEPQFEPTLVETVIEGTSAQTGVLDPLGAALDAGPDQYFRLMNGLADSLVDCLGTAKSG